MKLAIVHDWFINVGGAERVLLELHRLWPDAPIYTLLTDPIAVKTWLPHATFVTSHLQRLWGNLIYYPALAPLMPSAIESFDFSGYDCVVSNSVSFSKGIIVRPDTRHISYCYSPTRMLWDRAAAYERRGVMSGFVRHFLRSWDSEAAQRPDQLATLSQTTARRIAKYYRRDAIVIHPPARLAPPDEEPLERTGPYLAVGRRVPHKQFDVLRDAFARLNRPLFVASNVSDQELDQLYRTCRALVVASEEDWGLTAVEAMSHGAPVIALRAGGVTETVIDGVTGVFFDDAFPNAIADAVHRFEQHRDSFLEPLGRAHARNFGTDSFDRRMQALIQPV